MHVRYAHNTREHLGGIEQGKGTKKDTTLMLTFTLPTFLLCPRPAEYLVSPVAQGRAHLPCEPLRDRGSRNTTALRKVDLSYSPCHEEYVCLHALISHGVMTPACPVQNRPGPNWLVPATPFPLPSLQPQGTLE